ncbi:MAG: hypothetical protein WDN04_13975 [Rhodospirillales bacterium]
MMHPVKLGAVYKALLGLGICDDAADEWIAQPNLLLGGDFSHRALRQR